MTSLQLSCTVVDMSAFTTSAGVKGRTGSTRRFIVVHIWDRVSPPKAVIDYRTDDIDRANAYARRHGGEVIDLRPAAPVPTCRWFALCDREATRTRSHPVLGQVPICTSCDLKVHRLEREARA